MNAAYFLDYDPACREFEQEMLPAFPWTQPPKQDVARYQKGSDGYWYDPGQQPTGKALLRFTGDLMCEPAMCRRNRYSDTYFFHPCFQYVRRLLCTADLAVGNLETTVSDMTPYAGQYHAIPLEEKMKYHCNAPESYLDALRYAGFDVLVNANNHNCDSGIMGLKQTLDRLDAYQFMHTGTFRPADERVLLLKVNGIRIAILSYASRFNDLEVLWTEAGRRTWLNAFTPQKAAQDVAYAKARGAEYIFAYIHWGKDYEMTPNAQQMEILPQLAQSGVDYIIGSHTHCLQHFTYVEGAEGKTVPVMFSMGNFVTNEPRELCKHTGILQVQLRREGEKLQVQQALIPCYVFDEFGTGRYCVVPAIPELGGVDDPSFAQVRAYVRERVGQTLAFAKGCGASLAKLCAAMGLPSRPGWELIPVTRLCVTPESTCLGAIYFARGDETRQQRLMVHKNRVAAVVAQEEWDVCQALLTPDKKDAFEKACHSLLGHRFGKVIAITGSRGKTLTRQLLCHALKKRFSVLTHADLPGSDVGIWQAAQPHMEYTVLEVPEEVNWVLRAIAPDHVLCTDDFTGTDELPLPFDWQKTCAAGVRGFVKTLGILDPFDGFAYASHTQNMMSLGGVTVVYDLACRDAEAVLKAAADLPGRHLVMGAQLPETVNASLVWNIENMRQPEREQVLLENLKTGDVLILCAPREFDPDVTLRRMFGICTGYLKGAR